MDAEADLVHVAFLDIVHGVLEHAVRLPALSAFRKKAANRHPAGFPLVQKAAVIALHAQPAPPVSTHRLSKVLAHRRRQILRRCRLDLGREGMLEVKLHVHLGNMEADEEPVFTCMHLYSPCIRQVVAILLELHHQVRDTPERLRQHYDC